LSNKTSAQFFSASIAIDYSHDDFASGNARGRNNNNSRSIGAGGSIAGDSMVGGFGALVSNGDGLIMDMSQGGLKGNRRGRRGISTHEYGNSGTGA